MAIGIIIGLLIAILIFVVEESLSKQELSITRIIKNSLGEEEKPTEQGSIIGTDEEEEAILGIVEENAKKGKGTKISEIYVNKE